MERCTAARTQPVSFVPKRERNGERSLPCRVCYLGDFETAKQTREESDAIDLVARLNARRGYVGVVASSQALQLSEKDFVPRIVTGNGLVVNVIEWGWVAKVIGHRQLVAHVPVAPRTSTWRVATYCTVRSSHRADGASRWRAAVVPMIGMVEADGERCGDSNIANEIDSFSHHTDPTIGDGARATDIPL